MGDKQKEYAKYANKLRKKIGKITSQRIVTNDDLHKLNHLYDLLEYYDYYENESLYKAMVKAWQEEIESEQILL